MKNILMGAALVALVLTISGCGKDSEPKITAREALNDCRYDIERAIGRAMSRGKSDSAIMRAGDKARDECMASKGF